MTNPKRAEELADLLDERFAATPMNEAAAELRRLSAVEAERDRLRARLDRAVNAAVEHFGEDAIRYKFSLTKSGKVMQEFPRHMDGHWYALQRADNDAHVGLSLRCVEAEARADRLSAELERVKAAEPVGFVFGEALEWLASPYRSPEAHISAPIRKTAQEGDRPIYTAPQPAARGMEGLSEAQMLTIFRDVALGLSVLQLTRDVGPYEVTEPTPAGVELVRAIEAAHGIGGITSSKEGQHG